MPDEPKLIFPEGLTPKQARRMADIAEALDADLVDPNLYELTPHCEGCDCLLEAGHCYCCFPVSGYGDRFQEQRHGADFRPSFYRTQEQLNPPDDKPKNGGR